MQTRVATTKLKKNCKIKRHQKSNNHHQFVPICTVDPNRWINTVNHHYICSSLEARSTVEHSEENSNPIIKPNTIITHVDYRGPHCCTLANGGEDHNTPINASICTEENPEGHDFPSSNMFNSKERDQS